MTYEHAARRYGLMEKNKGSIFHTAWHDWLVMYFALRMPFSWKVAELGWPFSATETTHMAYLVEAYRLLSLRLSFVNSPLMNTWMKIWRNLSPRSMYMKKLEAELTASSK